jgi:hypothetical protein
MNWAIWLGIVFGAVSVFFLYFGSHIGTKQTSQDTAEAVRTEVNKVLQRIDAVQRDVADSPKTSAPPVSADISVTPHAAQRDAQQQLSDIDQAFSRWAADYIQDRDLKKLSFERQRLDARANELSLSNQYRPIFQQLVDSIRAAVNAYNAKTDAKFRVDLRDPPANLYSTPQNTIEIGSVFFIPEVFWTVNIFSEKPARADRLPYLYIDVQGKPRLAEDQLRVLIVPPNLRIATYGGGIVSAAKLPETYPLSTSTDAVKDLVQRLIEAQIASLPSP